MIQENRGKSYSKNFKITLVLSIIAVLILAMLQIVVLINNGMSNFLYDSFLSVDRGHPLDDHITIRYNWGFHLLYWIAIILISITNAGPLLDDYVEIKKIMKINIWLYLVVVIASIAEIIMVLIMIKYQDSNNRIVINMWGSFWIQMIIISVIPYIISLPIQLSQRRNGTSIKSYFRFSNNEVEIIDDNKRRKQKRRFVIYYYFSICFIPLAFYILHRNNEFYNVMYDLERLIYNFVESSGIPEIVGDIFGVIPYAVVFLLIPQVFLWWILDNTVMNDKLKERRRQKKEGKMTLDKESKEE